MTILIINIIKIDSKIFFILNEKMIQFNPEKMVCFSPDKIVYAFIGTYMLLMYCKLISYIYNTKYSILVIIYIYTKCIYSDGMPASNPIIPLIDTIYIIGLSRVIDRIYNSVFSVLLFALLFAFMLSQ